jgi:two-component system response regulator YesN
MHRPRLLIVDDDENIREIVSALAQEALPLAQIATHSSCQGAYRDFEQMGADLLITDCNMPEMSGPCLVRALRGSNYSLPVIMISGCAEARHAAAQVGVNCFLEKRFIWSHLADAIHSLLKAA